MTALPPLILASGSRYRAELLSRLGFPFEVRAPDVDESPQPEEGAATLVVRLARSKAAKIARQAPDAVVIGADQLAVCEGRILGKPGTRSAAIGQLRWMSGRTVSFITGMAVFGPTLDRAGAEVVELDFRHLSLEEIERYVDREQPLDCSGAIRTEGLGISLLERVRCEDPTALIGLPLIRLAGWLRDAGFPLP
ncbi:MAG: nucleoside triphosphate pyrophosphatase [Wenzhouxiangellaceae bacterium]